MVTRGGDRILGLAGMVLAGAGALVGVASVVTLFWFEDVPRHEVTESDPDIAGKVLASRGNPAPAPVLPMPAAGLADGDKGLAAEPSPDSPSVAEPESGTGAETAAERVPEAAGRDLLEPAGIPTVPASRGAPGPGVPDPGSGAGRVHDSETVPEPPSAEIPPVPAAESGVGVVSTRGEGEPESATSEDRGPAVQAEGDEHPDGPSFPSDESPESGALLPYEWILEQDPAAYTIQIMAGKRAVDVTRFARQVTVGHPMAYYAVTRSGQTWYILLSGVFEDRAEAQAAMADFPNAVRSNKPWVRSLRAVRNEVSRKPPESP